jgi:hypothetical protein
MWSSTGAGAVGSGSVLTRGRVSVADYDR